LEVIGCLIIEKTAKKILMNHNMLQRLREVRKLEKKRRVKKKKEEVEDIDFEKELITLQMLAKSDLKKFMEPRKDEFVEEDTENFLHDIIGMEQDEPMGFSDGFKSFPPLKPEIKNKKKTRKGLRFDSKSKISEVRDDDIDQSKSNYYSEKEMKETKVTFNESIKGSKKSEVNKNYQIAVYKPQKKSLLKNNSNPKLSRNVKNTLLVGKNKTESLPALHKKSFHSKLSNKAALAITDGSSFPSRRQPQLSLHPQSTSPNKTARQFSSKLNKDLPPFARSKNSISKKGPHFITKGGLVDEGVQATDPPKEERVLPRIGEEKGVVEVMRRRVEEGDGFQEVISNLDRVKGRNGKVYEFYKMCMKSQKALEKAIK
jgi:hypothetical protein